MPNLDGTGPKGKGSQTGRGLGECGKGKQTRKRFGFGRKQCNRLEETESQEIDQDA